MHPADKISVAILDDHLSIIDGYLFRLNGVEDIDVVGTAAYAEQIEPILANCRVDVLLLDIQVPIAPNNPNPYPVLQCIPRWLQLYPQLAVLVISMHNLPTLLKAVMEAGASGYILKEDQYAVRNLDSLIRSAYDGGIYLSPNAQQKLLKRQPDWPDLTPRQIEVLSLCAAYPDATTFELALKLNIANSTIRNLLSSAYLRLGVRSRAAATAKAQQLGLIVPPFPVDY
jgi:two-component system NarL family response regulator